MVSFKDEEYPSLRVVASTTGYTFFGILPRAWDLLLPPGPTDFSVSFERHGQSGVNGIAKVPKWRQWDSIPRPPGRQPYDVTTELLVPLCNLFGKH